MPRIQVKQDWEAIKADPVEFARKLIKGPDGTAIEPFEAQQQILRGIKRRTVIDTGRQFGKTTTMGMLVAHKAVTNANWHICIVAPSLEQARIMFSEVESYFSTGMLASFVSGKIKQYPFPVLTLKNGTKVTARGANSPQFIRGNRFHLIVCDEAAFIKDSTIAEAIEPTMTVTGKAPGAALVLVSTPWGDGPFREWYDEAQLADTDPDLAAFHFTSFDNPHADRKFLENVKKRYGEDSLIWRTEYLGIFPEDDMSVFPWRDIEWATTNYPFLDKVNGAILFPHPAEEGHRYVQGADLANLRDYFVATVLDILDPSAVPLVRMDRYQKRGYGAVKATIRANYQNYLHAKTLIDATTLAESVVEDLADINAEGYKFGGSAAKYEVVQELARMMSEHRLLLPPDRDIVDELRFFKYELTPSKNVRMEASQGHDDIVMSLGLAAHLANIPRRLGLFQVAKMPGLVTPKPKRRKVPVTPDGRIDYIFGE
jgi:hypothetical protein